MDFMELVKERYSCRKFSSKKVENEKIEQILTAGLVAPTAVNKQPYKIWVVKTKQAREKIENITRFSFGAPLFFVVGACKKEAWVRKYDQRNFADVDASIVATQMMLAIHSLELGTTWVGHFDAPKLQEMFQEMKDYDLIAIFPVGYPSEDAQPSPSHYERKRKEEVVTVL